MTTVLTGLDRVLAEPPHSLKNRRLGLICNQASVTAGLDYGFAKLLQHPDCNLSALFGPQHGPFGHTQDNMIEWEGATDQRIGRPVYSLYGSSRKPTPAMVENLDALVFDLQEVGARYYTFIWTLVHCMEAAREHGLPLIVLDRPNPIGGDIIEGNLLDSDYASFVGLLSIPPRHGMTIGELARLFADFYGVSCELSVIEVGGWRRWMTFSDTGLPWVLPSPNMPTEQTALVYPGMCLLEGTNLSEGRGTTRPFEIFGAPFIEPFALVKRLETLRLPGVKFRPLDFLPTFQKHAGILCGGAQIHVLDQKTFRPYRTAVYILRTVRDLYGAKLQWRLPPYEYETEKLPIDILAGTSRLRIMIDNLEPIAAFETWFQADEALFAEQRRPYLLYE